MPSTPDLPPAQRRLDEVCADIGISDDSLGETVRTRTTVLQAHTHQWVGTFSGATGAGNGEYRGELRQAVRAKSRVYESSIASSEPGRGQAGRPIWQRRDCRRPGWTRRTIMRGKDYDLLDLPQVQARLAQPPDQQVTHPETGTCRSLFDFPDLLLSPTGPRARVIVAAREAPDSPVKVGTTRGERVYELFYTARPSGAFTSADVVALYLHRGAFETVLADEDKEQEPDRWCSHTAWGQECWLIVAQWTWNLRLELGHALHPAPMRTTEFAPVRSPEPVAKPDGATQAEVSCHFAGVGGLAHGMSRR